METTDSAPIPITPLLRSAAASEPSPAESPPPSEVETAAAITENRFGKYVRVSRLGHGGMGEVWKAWDSELCRWVALKFPRFGEADELDRVRREAQAAGRLSHPNVTAIYEVGQAQGLPFIAMQYVDGSTLAEMPRGDRRRCVAWLREAVGGVAHAHDRGLVHRDLKPSNIMVDRERGQAYVTDFGLARIAGPQASSTAIVGTPSYMSPEQAVGRTVDARSDVYSLGATLYDLLTERPPFDGKSAGEVMRNVLCEEPPPPPRCDADLRTIVMKCLEKDPARRYSTARALEEDLARWERGEAIRARPPSVLYRWRKRLARRKAAVAIALSGALALAVALVTLLPLLRTERIRKKEAERRLLLWQRVSTILADADLLSRAGERERARDRIQEGIVICRAHLSEGDFADGHYFLGRLLHARRDRTSARRELDRALAMNPGFGEARFERGLLLSEEYEDRLRLYVISGELRTDPLSMAFELESVHPDLGELRKSAIADLAAYEGTSAYYRETDARFGRAVLDTLRMSRSVEEQLLRILESDPLDIRARYVLALLSSSAGRFDQAVEHSTRAVELHRGFGRGYTARAWAYWGKGDLRAALADQETAVRLGEDSVYDYACLGALYAASGNREEAARCFRRSLETEPENATVRRSLDALLPR